MYEFKWTIPAEPRRTITLQIASRQSWIGRKTLCLDDRVVYRRGPLEGIEHKFFDPDLGHNLRLTWEPIRGSCSWRPVLFCNGTELPETTRCQPPVTVRRPALLAVMTGVTYLAMFMLVVMVPHIWSMLYAGRGHSDSRTLALDVVGDADTSGVILGQDLLPAATVGQTYEASLAVERGEPPFVWQIVKGVLPDGLVLDTVRGRLSGTPVAVGDKVVRVRAKDARGRQGERLYVVSIRPSGVWEPRIVTRALPRARSGAEYDAALEVAGGQPPYDWTVNTRKLPKGVSFDSKKGQLRGQVAADSGGVFPLRFRVTDGAYSPSQDIVPWLVPFAATALCLLGYWNMRRWGVVLYGILLLGQVGAGAVTQYPLVWGAMIPQAIILCVGAAYFRRMQ